MQPEDTFNRGGFIAFIFSMAFSLIFFVYIAFIHPGVDLKEVPESEAGAEQTMADGSGTSAAPKKVDVSGVTNPWVSSEDMIIHGATVYKTNCAVCHGPKGAGDGPAGAGLVPKPRNLVEGEWKAGGDSIGLYKTIQNGLDGTSMAAFGHIPKIDRWALVHWIRSVTKNKAEDDAAKLEEFGKSSN